MKKLIRYCLLATTCSLVIYACKKSALQPEESGNSIKGAASLSKSPVGGFGNLNDCFFNNGCELIQVTDDQGYFNIPFTYDAEGNLASWYGYPISYDNRNRLSKVDYPAQGNLPYYRVWKYRNDSSLPEESTLYYLGS